MATAPPDRLSLPVSALVACAAGAFLLAGLRAALPSMTPSTAASSCTRWATYSAPSRTLAALAPRGGGLRPSLTGLRAPPVGNVPVRQGDPVLDQQDRNRPDDLT